MLVVKSPRVIPPREEPCTDHRLQVRNGNAGNSQPASQAETAKQINKTNLRENMSPDCGRTTDIWKTTNALRTV